MSHHYYDTSPRSRNRDHSPIKSSPLRHTLSTISHNSDSSAPSRQGTISSNASSAYSQQSSAPSGYSYTEAPMERSSVKRDRSESPVKKNAAFAKWEAQEQATQNAGLQAFGVDRRQNDSRSSLKKMREYNSSSLDTPRAALHSVAPNAVSQPVSRIDSAADLAKKEPQMFSVPAPPAHSHSRAHSVDTSMHSHDNSLSSAPSSRNSLATISRSDSIRGNGRPRQPGHARFKSMDVSSPRLDQDDLAQFQESSTPQLRHLSKIASDATEDLGVQSSNDQVVGLVGRRKLQRSNSVRPTQQNTSSFGSQWQSTKWMDSQRKHIQAYEYLCHIGEARAWLEDVLDPEKLPPIVQLEEALRDGVTLAEVVNILAANLNSSQRQSLGNLKIFRSPRLQFRHSDNIALFFRFLAAIDLPDLFRFELVDLYEKKNIPKVIYCIHALSWLLYRQGITTFTISHLVGQLEFTGEELEETQKGIDRSGLKMPDFGGMRKELEIPEPPPPPDPTPEELVMQHETVLEDFQCQIRGALVRMRLGGVMQDLWDQEHMIALLQARIRGGNARELFDFRFMMDLSTRKFQAAAKGMIARHSKERKQQAWTSAKGLARIVKLQSIWRGKMERAETAKLRSQLRSTPHGLKDLQAAIRGALGRWRASDVWEETRTVSNEDAVVNLQAAIRGRLQRARISQTMEQLWNVEPSFNTLQAMLRGHNTRQVQVKQQKRVEQCTATTVNLQAAIRGLIERRRQHNEHGERQTHEAGVVQVQTFARGLLARVRHARTTGALQGCESKVIDLQSLTRAMLQRRSIGTRLAKLEEEEPILTTLQSLTRGYLERQRIFDQLVEMEEKEAQIIQLQALSRAMLLRGKIDDDLTALEAEEVNIVEVQSSIRAYLVRQTFAAKKAHYNANMQKVVKLQSYIRAKQQGQSYESLMKGANPPLPVVRRHIHLLTDSHLEFESELEAERLRRLFGERVKEIEEVEGYVETLSEKIGLLVGNRIGVDEMVKHQKNFGGSASRILRQGSSLRHNMTQPDLKGLNKNSRKKLSGYEELFFHLQTQPGYLARLMHHLGGRGLADKDLKQIERLIMTIFGSAVRNREEYLFLQVLTSSNENAIRATRSIDEFCRWQNGSLSQRLFLTYVRTQIHRDYLKYLLGNLVKDGICGQEHLDLQSNPSEIYRSFIANEELNSGPSSRPRDLPPEVIMRDPAVRSLYVKHLSDLRDLCDGFFQSLEETMHRMPFGVRHLCAQQFDAMAKQYPHNDTTHLAMLAGTWLWRNFIQPAFKEPEMWGVINRGLADHHKRNLAQVTLVVGQVCSYGHLFGQEQIYLQPLNSWIGEAVQRWQNALQDLFSIKSAEEHFDADQFSDLYARNKPTVYIKLSDICQIHDLITSNLGAVVISRDDPIKELLGDLGSAKGNEAEFNGAAGGREITLTLKSRYKVQEDPHAEVRALFTATKRLVLFIIRVQSGTNLMEILLRPISHEDDDRWIELVREEAASKLSHGRNNAGSRQQHGFDPRASLRGGRTESMYSEAPSGISDDTRVNNLLDLEGMTYAELKSQALENILTLESHSTPPQFRVTRQNNYQELLNALAGDIRSKHRRRLDQQRELENSRQKIANLDEKAEYCEAQLTKYNDFIEQSLHTLANKNVGNKGFKLPFTKQWLHERELERAGRQPKFGSYKYSAKVLYEKGVLAQWTAYPMENWGSLNFVISSDQVGVFHIEASSGSMMLPGASTNLMIGELLQAQSDEKSTISVFRGNGRGEDALLATDQLVALLYKKFYTGKQQ